MWSWAGTHVEFILVVIAMALLIVPIGLYLTGPWVYRRREILALLPPEAVALYFKRFFANAPRKQRDFEAFYEARFGRLHYAVPMALLIAVALVPVDWTIETALAWSGHSGAAVRLPPQAAAAIAGAYTWVSVDMLWRWQFRDLLPIHVTRAALRFAVAVPAGYAFGALAAETLRVFVAFAVAAFPTGTLLTLTRRVFRRKLELGDADETAESELEKLQGIDTRVAERFADEGYTTMVQLAYADPIELTMRCSSFAFSFVIDCVSQALAWIYLEERLPALRVMSLRGAQEIGSFIEELADESNPLVARKSRAMLEAMAANLSLPTEVLERTFEEIAEDPYTEFLRKVWQQPAESDEEETIRQAPLA